jgi:hypothetical protein
LHNLPYAPANYAFDYPNEQITVVSDSLHFARINTTQWTSRLAAASWTFADAGWGEGVSERLFNVRIPATDNSFASSVRIDTILARPAAPDVNLKSNSDISKIVVTGTTAGTGYQCSTTLNPTWVSYPPTGAESDSIAFAPDANCFVRFAATATKPASQWVMVTVAPKINFGTISGDQAICYNTVPPQKLTFTPSVNNCISGDFTYQWQQSEDNGVSWNDIDGEESQEYIPSSALTYTTAYRLLTSDDTQTEASNTVVITVYPATYPDLRIRVCPDAGKTVNLWKYIDTAKVTSIQWTSLSPYINATSGVVSTDYLGSSRVNTFMYTVDNSCATGINAKIYVETLRTDRINPHDTIVMCYKQAEAIQINQLFGIDAGDDWEYYSNVAGDIDAYVHQPPSSPNYYGAVIMDGKGIYSDPSISPYPYHGNASAKKAVFIYKPNDDSCLKGKTFERVIILIEN